MAKTPTEKTREYRERLKADGWVRMEMHVPWQLRGRIAHMVTEIIAKWKRERGE